MKKPTTVTTEKFYTVSAVLQIYEYTYTEFFSLSLDEISNKFDSWARTGHQVLRSSLRLGDDYVSFIGFSDLIGVVSQYEDTHVMTRTR